MAGGGRRLDVAVAIAGAAVVVGVLVAAVALRDRVGGRGGCSGRRRGRRGGRGGRRRGMGVMAGAARACFGGAAAAACGGAAWAWLCAAPAGFGAAGCAGGPPDEPHAASVTATAAAGSASSIRGWRLSSFSRVRDLVIVSPCGAAGSRPGACRAAVGGGADGPGMTATMPRPRPGAIAASPQPHAWPAGIPAFLLAATGRSGPLVSGLSAAGPIGVGRPAAQPMVRHPRRRRSLPRSGWSLLGVAASG